MVKLLKEIDRIAERRERRIRNQKIVVGAFLLSTILIVLFEVVINKI